MNIVFSTTRQWNPGDEFIHRGIVNLLYGAGLRFNAIAWNRHPSIRPGNTQYDNSFDELRHDPKSIDYVIFAGTPEWQGRKVAPLYRMIAEAGLRCAFLGIGNHGDGIGLSRDEEHVLRGHTDLITCRDQSTYESLKRLVPDSPVHLLPCPSIFHASQTQKRDTIARVAVIYQSTYTIFQTVSAEQRDHIITLIRELQKHVEVDVLANYIDECVEASLLFGSDNVTYSYTSSDYEALFRRVDCVVGARVHGCLGALGVGTTAMLLGTSSDGRRKGVADQIPVLLQGDTNNLDAVIRSILDIDAPAQSSRIIDWREQQRAIYMPLIEQLSCVTNSSQASPGCGPVSHEQTAEVLRTNEERYRRQQIELENRRRLPRRVKGYLKRRLPRPFPSH